MKGYKVFNSDFTCRDFQYKENTTFVFESEIKMCGAGFHFCEKASDCFNYCRFNPQYIVCEVEALGETIKNNHDSKIVTNKLHIGRKMSWEEVLKAANEGSGNSGYGNSGDRNSGHKNSGHRNSAIWNSGDMNSGDWNSGNWNSGDWNSGDRNSGDWNSGNWNSGNWNSGDMNSGDMNSGAFCTEKNPYIKLFDKMTNITVKEWLKSDAVRIVTDNLVMCEWIHTYKMSEEEKESHPEYKITGGYLKTKTMHKAWKDMWNNLTEEDKKVFLELPNFDAKKFEVITGIKVKKVMEDE